MLLFELIIIAALLWAGWYARGKLISVEAALARFKAWVKSKV